MASFPTDQFSRFSGYETFLKAFDAETPASGLLSATAPVNQPVESWIRELFGYVSNEFDFNRHPVTLMVVNFMQKLEDTIIQDPKNPRPFRNVLFPNLDTRRSPNNFSIDGLQAQPFKDGGQALTAKAFCNRSGYFHDEFNVEKFNTNITALNNYFNSKVTALFAEFYRNSFGISPSASAVAQYSRLLNSDSYRILKAAELGSEGWRNPALEIFNHLVKLRACGAEDSDISTIFEKLTTADPPIDAKAIVPLTASTWKSYRGWLPVGYLDWGDMDAQNLSMTYRITSKGHRAVMSRDISICQNYMFQHRYYKLDSGSCFAGDTKVVLADGQSYCAIQKIAVGDDVQSFKFISNGPPKPLKAKVAFVAQVPRDGRTLYELREKRGILFTGTHPIILRGDSEMPMLGFVDPDLARSLNPTWQSIPIASLGPVEAHPATDANKNEILYDLILEAIDDEPTCPSIYVLSDYSGKRLEVASEAPLMEWFPYATCFFYSIMQELKRCGENAVKCLLLACKGDTSLISALDSASKAAWERTLKMTSGHYTHPKNINIHTMFGQISPEDQPLSAIILENLINRLGRQINDRIETAWANERAVKEEAHFLVLNTMTYQSRRLHPSYPIHEELRFVVAYNTVEVANQIVPTRREGWMTFEIQHALRLDIDPNTISYPLDLQIRIFSSNGQPLHLGRGPILDNTTTLIGLADLSNSADSAILKLRVRKLDPRVVSEWQDTAKWDADGKIEFAAALGRCFTEELLSGAEMNHTAAESGSWRERLVSQM